MIPSLYDAHNHLQDEWLQPYHREIWDRLGRVRLGGAIVNGTMEQDWSMVDQLARQHPWITPSYGLHPWFIGSRSVGWAATLEAYLRQGGLVGEIGLDRWKQPFDFSDQQAVFRQQLHLARAYGRPVTVHCLQAWGALLEILRAEAWPGLRFLLHAYIGSREMVDELAELGAYFSFSGYFLHERKQERRDVFRQIPWDRLLAETDAPAMPLPPSVDLEPLPASPTGQPVNHPVNIVAVYGGLARLRGVNELNLALQLQKNYQEFLHGVSAAG